MLNRRILRIKAFKQLYACAEDSGKSLKEALKLTNKAVAEALDGLPPVKMHCSLLAEEAIHAAVEDYLKNHPEEAEKLKD